MKSTYCVYNRTRESFLSLRTVRANTTASRLRGLLGRLTLSSDEGVWLVPSQGIHTFGLRFSIDLIYLDDANRVLETIEHIRPYRLTPLRSRSATVLELPAHTIYNSRTQVGDELVICEPEQMDHFLGESEKKAAAAGKETAA